MGHEIWLDIDGERSSAVIFPPDSPMPDGPNYVDLNPTVDTGPHTEFLDPTNENENNRPTSPEIDGDKEPEKTSQPEQVKNYFDPKTDVPSVTFDETDDEALTGLLDIGRKRVDMFSESSRIVDSIESFRPNESTRREFVHYRFDKETNRAVKINPQQQIDSTWCVMPNPDPDGILDTDRGQYLRENLSKASQNRVDPDRMKDLMSRALTSLVKDATVIGLEGCMQSDMSEKTFENDVAPMLVHGILSDNIKDRIARCAYNDLIRERLRKIKCGEKPENLPSDEELREKANAESNDVATMVAHLSDIVAGTGSPEDKSAAQAMYRTIMQDASFGIYGAMMNKYDPRHQKKMAELWRKYMQEYLQESKGNANRLTSPDDMLALSMIVSAANPVMLALYLFPVLIPVLFSGVSRWTEIKHKKNASRAMMEISNRAHALSTMELMGSMTDAMARSISCGEDPSTVMKTMIKRIPEMRPHFSDLVRQNIQIGVMYPEGSKQETEEERKSALQDMTAKIKQMEHIYDTLGNISDISRIISAIDKSHRIFHAGGKWNVAIDTTSMDRLAKTLRDTALRAGAEPDPRNPDLLVQPGRPSRELTEYQTFVERRARAQATVEELTAGLNTEGAILRRPITLETLRIISDGLTTLENKDGTIPTGIGSMLAGALLDAQSDQKVNTMIAEGRSSEEILREIVCSLAANVAHEPDKSNLSPVGIARAAVVKSILDYKKDLMEKGMNDTTFRFNSQNVKNVKEALSLFANKNDKNIFTDTFAGSVLRATQCEIVDRLEKMPRLSDIKNATELEIANAYVNRSIAQKVDLTSSSPEAQVVLDKVGDALTPSVRSERDEVGIGGLLGMLYHSKLMATAARPETLMNTSTVEHLYTRPIEKIIEERESREERMDTMEIGER